MNPVDKYENYWKLSWEIWQDNEIQSALKEWWEILLSIDKKQWKDSEIYKKFEKEYKDLYEVIDSAFEDDKQFSQEERSKIMFELWDIIALAQDNWIVEKKWRISRLWDFLKWTNTNEVKQKAEALREKKVNDFSVDEAISAMEYLNSNYSDPTKYKPVKNDDYVSKWLTFQYSSINELDDQYEVRKFQDELLKKIFPNWTWFNDKYIAWFNNEKWNYLVTIWDFEKQLKWWIKVWDINSRALWNYFLYLKNQNKLDSQNLLNIFWPNVLFELAKIWEKTDDKDGKYAFNYLKNNGWEEILDIIKLFSSTDIFLKEAYKLKDNPEKAELAIELLEKNSNSIKEQFRKDLKEKFKKSNPNMSENEIEDIITEMFSKLEKHKDLNWLLDIYKTFDEYNKKYKLWLDINKEAEELLRQKALNSKTQILRNSQEIVEAEKKWDKGVVEKKHKENEKLKIELRKLELSQKANKKFSPQDISDLVSWKKDFAESIEEFKKQEDFGNLYNEVEKEKKDFEEKYWKEKSNTWEIEVSDKQINYGDWKNVDYKNFKWWNYLIDIWWKEIDINNEEFNVISKSKEALNNLVNFIETLDELNLTWLWNYRENIFKWVSNKYTFTFNLWDDYLWEQEVKIFLLAIMASVWIKIDNITKVWANLDKIKQIILTENFNWSVLWQKDVNNMWDSNIENIFISQFDPNRNWWFLQNKFEESLSWLFGVEA